MAHRLAVLLPPHSAIALTDYELALDRSSLGAATRDKYRRHVQRYLHWLAGMQVQGDPLQERAARDHAVRSYYEWLRATPATRGTATYRRPSTINNVMSALDDFYIRRGLGHVQIVRDQAMAHRAPPVLDLREIRSYLRSSEGLAWRAEDARLSQLDRARARRDRLLAELPYHAGLRVNEIITLDVVDVRLSEQRNRLRVRANGRRGARDRLVPINAELLPQLQEWLKMRDLWPGAQTSILLFPGRGGRRLSSRFVNTAVARVAAAAGLDRDRDPPSPQMLRNTLARRLLDEGTPIQTVASILGIQSLDSTNNHAVQFTVNSVEAMGKAIVRYTE